ncbi:hypothetical protein [Bradyrhizobium sp.]|jgi:hypothetical protein|uniref:hypothetical protein n=1 Tax=Bradyrhizobium sp. TaxID=376 RepID=UPI002DDCF024|nr:hypothetical protein [Bradyrhizobium sp.]HEV2154485.1 hypothetical protein [Bradyrhizobium sp.]
MAVSFGSTAHIELRRTSLRALRAFGVMPAIVLSLCASLLVALEAPSKPFLDKNSFYLASAGFRVQVANDAAGQKALRALPPHRFVMHGNGGNVRYLYAEPLHCVCIFIGTQSAYEAYRGMLSRGADQPDVVSADYKTQASALLDETPAQLEDQVEPDSLADYFRPFY